MHIHLIMPVISSEMNQNIISHFEKVTSPDTKLTISTVTTGPISIESMYDEEIAAVSILEETRIAAENGVDGVIIYCFGNPAIEAAKELVDIPVLGIGEASQTIGLPLCENYGIISTVANSVARNKRKVKVLGTYEKLGAIIPLNLSVVELTNHSEELINKIVDVIQPHIDEKGIDLLHLGCGYLIGLSGVLSEKLKVPVIDPGLASVKLMETYIALGIAQSKKSYMTPPKKQRILNI